mmetsp:Transcript_84119/g.103054  ORF Transcript_84119/g.103054 Transcript_84119/m.103054 type:complete len:102 (-) Transcript_84119:436-741(-)
MCLLTPAANIACVSGAFKLASIRDFFRFSREMARFSMASHPVISVPLMDLQSRIKWVTEASALLRAPIARMQNSCKRRVFAKLNAASILTTTDLGGMCPSG